MGSSLRNEIKPALCHDEALWAGGSWRWTGNSPVGNRSIVLFQHRPQLTGSGTREAHFLNISIFCVSGWCPLQQLVLYVTVACMLT